MVSAPVAAAGRPGPEVRLTMFSITVPTRIWVGLSACTASSVSVTGMSSSSVTRCTTVVAERSTRMIESAWLRIGPTLASPETASFQELGDPPGRRGIQDHGVVRVGRPLLAPPDRLVHLPGEQYVAEPGGDGGGEVDRPEPVERLTRDGEVVEGLEVLQQGVLGVDGQPEDAAAERRTGDPPLLGADQVGHGEQARRHPAVLDLAEQHPAAAGGQGAGQCAGDGGRLLALAADDVQRVPRRTRRKADRRVTAGP